MINKDKQNEKDKPDDRSGNDTDNADRLQLRIGNETEAGSKGKPLGVRSGIIEYACPGDKTGKSTQYFDDYGMKSAVYAEIVQQGEKSKGWVVTI